MLREAQCRECSAPICWVTLAATATNPAPAHPVDMAVQPYALPGLVVVNPEKNTGIVLTNADRDSGAVYNWLEAGAELHLSHFATCPAAQAVRDHNPNQETLDV